MGDDPECVPDEDGPIGTLPWYFENGLVADGDPALAFGPRRANGEFSWENGSRLYYANLTSNFPVAKRSEQTFKGAEAIYVSRTDNVAAAAADVKSAWMQPVQVSKQSSATFADKEQIWADNAESSDFFGNVYICYAKFIGSSAPMVIATSRDAGSTWTESKVSAAHNAAATHWGQSGCTVRTDSDGVVYAFWEEFQNPLKRFPPIGTHFLVKSFDGGATWTKPRALHRVWNACAAVDPVIVRCVEDGVAEARSDLSAAPSVDISNGAPSGADATDRIVVAWADARDGTNNEHVMVSYSTDHGQTFSSPQPIETAGDRGYYAAPAISPNGTDVYVVYNAFTTRTGRRRRHRGRSSEWSSTPPRATSSTGRRRPGPKCTAASKETRAPRARTTSRPSSSATTSTRSQRGPTARRFGTTSATVSTARTWMPGASRFATAPMWPRRRRSRIATRRGATPTSAPGRTRRRRTVL